MKKIALAALAAALFTSAATVARAGERGSFFSMGEGGPSFTFGAATSFVFDINQPDNQITHENQKLYSGGESEESFNVDLVQLGISGSRGRASYRAKIDLGDWVSRIDDLFGDNTDDIINFQEMFLAIDTGPVVVSAGRLPTPLGYEVLEPWDDPNISRSRAWYYQAISHDGAAVAGEVGGVSLMAAVVNGIHINDSDANNPDGEYGVVGSAGMPIGETDLRLSVVYSDEQDSVRYVEVNPIFSGNHGRWRYGLEGTWLDGDRHGNGTTVPKPLDVSVLDATGYGGATFGHWSGDLRLSFTHQEGTNRNFLDTNKDDIVSFTATGGYEIVGGVVVRAEYRVDSANDDIFDDHNSNAAGGQTDLCQVVQIQLMWTPGGGRK